MRTKPSGEQRPSRRDTAALTDDPKDFNAMRSVPGAFRDISQRHFGGLVHLREDELAQRWRISLRTLQRWRRAGRGPAHLLIGHRVLYRCADVEAFERRHLRDGEVKR